MKKEQVAYTIFIIIFILLIVLFEFLVNTPQFSPEEFSLPASYNCSNESIKQVWSSIFKENSDNLTVITNESLIEIIKTTIPLTECRIYLAYKIKNEEEVYLIYGHYSSSGGFNAGENSTYNLAIKANVTSDYISLLKNLTTSNLSVINTGNTELEKYINIVSFLKAANIPEEIAESDLKTTFKAADRPALKTLREETTTFIELTQYDTMNTTEFNNTAKTVIMASLNFTILSYENFGIIRYNLPNLSLIVNNSTNKTECIQNWTIKKTNCTREEISTIWYKDINECNITNLTYSQNRTEKCDFENNNIIGKEESIINKNLNVTIFIASEKLNLSKIYNKTTKKIEIKENNISRIEFEYDFKEPLDIMNLTIEKQPANSQFGYIVVNGLNYTKTVRVDRLNSSSSKVCLINNEIKDLSEFTSACNSSKEISLSCPEKKAGFICNMTGAIFIIQGLTSSAAREFIETQNKSNIISNQTCIEKWNCDTWSSCINGRRARACKEVNNCNATKSIPPLEEACEIPQLTSSECIENWNCTLWSPKSCPEEKKQKRTCTDLNNCNPALTKEEEKFCEYKNNLAWSISIIAIIIIMAAVISAIIYLIISSKKDNSSTAV